MVYPVPWYLSLLISFPQTIIMLLLGFTLFNLKVPFLKFMYIAALLSVFSYFIRHLPITLTENSLLIVTAIAIFSKLVLKYKMKYVFPPVLCGFVLYAVIEISEVFFIFKITNYDLKSMIENPWIDFGCFLPALILSIVVYLVIKYYHLVILELSNISNS